MKSETTIFVTQPQEVDNDLSEEDKGDKHCIGFYLKNLEQKVLCAEAEAY